MAKLIAPTLLNSHDWMYKCPMSWKAKAFNDMSNTLNRAEWTPNDAVKNGILFEDYVYDICKKVKTADDIQKIKSSDMFKRIVATCHGGKFQKVSKNFIEIDGVNYCLYGRLDVWFPALIIDIKTTGNFKGDSQYNKGWQSIFYCYNESIKDFIYLVAEWMSKTDFRLKKVHEVHIHYPDPKLLENKIVNKIREFIKFLKENPELEKAYHTKYNKYDKD